MWGCLIYPQGTCPLFSNPSESICERIYTEEHRKTPPPATSECNPIVNPVSDQTEDIADLVSVSALDLLSETQADATETPQRPSPGENTALLPVESRPFSPYCSQNTIEISPTKTSRQCLLPVKSQTVYVTLDVFEHHESSENLAMISQSIQP